MKLRWKEQEGSALLLVVFLIVLFMMLGMAIIGATLGGAKRSMTRESDVQSLHLAERALNEAAAQIAVKFEDQDSIDLNNLDRDLEQIKDTVNGSKTESELADGAGGEIIGFDYTLGPGQTVGGTETKEVRITVKAQANVNGVTRILAQEITLSSYPDFLKYAFGSESTVDINGAPYLIGDFYSGGNLRVKNQADYRYNLSADAEDQHYGTQFPTIDGTAFVQEDKDTIQVCQQPQNFTTDCAGYAPIEVDDADETSGLADYIHTEKVEYQPQEKFVSISVEESFLDKLSEAAGDTLNRSNYHPLDDLPSGDSVTSTTYASQTASDLIQSLKGSFVVAPDKPVLPEEADDEQVEEYFEALDDYQNFYNGAPLERSVIRNGDLVLDGYELQKLTYDAAVKNDPASNAWFVVNGNLTINNLNPDPNAPLNVLGNILVNGNVTIRGNVKMDATIFALGQTTIEDAKISGMVVNDKEKELLLLSKGNIFINRVASFNPVTSPYNLEDPDNQGPDSPDVLKAFLYTDADAELYGVGSAFWIKGGFFAKGRLTINAVLGNTTAPTDGGSELVFEDVLNEQQASDADVRLRSRFIIQYDDQIYSDQNVGLPRVKTLNITVGKKHFADDPG